MANVTELYIDRLYEMSQMQLPASTISEARKCLMDFLACTFAGAATLRDEQNNFLNAFPPSAEVTALVPNKRAARVVLRFKDGSEKQMQIDYPKGEPENPLSDADMEEKFYSLAVFGGKTPEQADKIIAVVRDVEHCLPQLWDLVI